jgi:hypothetical protein
MASRQKCRDAICLFARFFPHFRFSALAESGAVVAVCEGIRLPTGERIHMTKMRTSVVLGFIGAVAITVGADAQQSGLPNNFLTPGDTKKVSKEQICSSDFAAKMKPTKDSVKEEAFERYGLRAGQFAGDVLDHLVPVELGGSDQLENLWPQPVKGEWNATQKDALEQKLHAMVCDGTMELKTAQAAIRKNWVAAYTQYVAGGAVKAQ